MDDTLQIVVMIAIFKFVQYSHCVGTRGTKIKSPPEFMFTLT